MPFVIKKELDHGTTNPIVARLSLQTLKILQQTTAPKTQVDAVGKLYHENLQRALLRCYEIKERFSVAFNEGAQAYETGAKQRNAVEIPQIPNLEAEMRNFLIEAKGFLRDVLLVVNELYGSDFEEASEFTRARKKKGAQSFLEFAAKNFGEHSPQTAAIREFGPFADYVVAMRNASEHPDGYSGRLVIKNFELLQDGRLDEPTWHREKDGGIVQGPSAIRADIGVIIENLLLIAEELFVSWANANLKGEGMMQIVEVPEERRDPSCAIRFEVGPSRSLQEMIAKARTSNARRGGQSNSDQ